MTTKLLYLVALIPLLLVLAPSLLYAAHSHPPPNDNNKPTVNIIEKGPTTSASGNPSPSGATHVNGIGAGPTSVLSNPPPPQSSSSKTIKVCNKQVIPGYDCSGNKITSSTPTSTTPTPTNTSSTTLPTSKTSLAKTCIHPTLYYNEHCYHLDLEEAL
jgi:hypothetical protein